MRIKVDIKGIGDPYILLFEDVYYLYATSMDNGFKVWTSADLYNWNEPSVCYEKGERSFGSKWFWAPEVYYFNHKFYMYYTAQWGKYETEELRLGVAVSDSPLGPFEDVFEKTPMFDSGYGLLDGNILCDDDGKKYLYYSCAAENNIINGHKHAEIFVVELADDCVTVLGEPRRLLSVSQEWEKSCGINDKFWNEGPFVLKHDGKYHIMYSANAYFSKEYGIGAAVSDSPMGSFVKYETNPILHFIEGELSGPGHNSVVKAKDGNLYCVYHAHTHYDHPGGDRQVYISPMSFKDGKIIVDFK